ncbi:MAG: stage IV sporulation protein A [Lachnospiraceae bacterium]|nr:stage IV sporulation protein A [Lachnospiraceae bacterium]
MAFNIYNDINERTNGEIYIGVVGPVRTGKSTFIKNFMDIMVIPNISDSNDAKRTKDELPQSAKGRTIMTTEPKFIPQNAAKVNIGNDVYANFKLIDCVGYIVDGAEGVEENGEERKVKTPWFDYEIAFSKAAETGTKKVIEEHSSIGIVITTDGSFGEIDRSAYEKPEERTILELKKLGKPFVVVVNSANPTSTRCQNVKKYIEEKYDVTVLAVNCLLMNEDDIKNILEKILFEFSVVDVCFETPNWIDILTDENPIKQYIFKLSREILNSMDNIKNVNLVKEIELEEVVDNIEVKGIDLSGGIVKLQYNISDSYYYEALSNLTGTEIKSEYELIKTIKDMSGMRKMYDKVNGAIEMVRQKGYGIVTPDREEIILEDPTLIKNGGKYGVKIKATSPSMHFIKANVLTEIAPIIGTKEQAEDLISFIKNNTESDEGIWDTNIFGKTIEQIVEEGINTKIGKLTDETQQKVQTTVEKITNEQNRGVICILL